MLKAIFEATFNVHARVGRGAELLDRRRPGWAAEINVDRLDVAYARDCPLGQIYGHYYHGLVALGEPIRIMQPRTASRHGFLESYACWLIPSLCRLEFACLRDAWIAAIRERGGCRYRRVRTLTFGDDGQCRCRTVAIAADGTPSYALVE